MRALPALAIMGMGLGCATLLGAAPEGLKTRLKAGDPVVWAGLDYSRVRMVGPGDFRDPAAIFPDMIKAWNALFLTEMMGKVESALKCSLVPDTAGVAQRNQAANPQQILPAMGPKDGVDQTHITPEDLAQTVTALKLESKEGVGLVFVADRLVKPEAKGAVYVVFFDVASREILASQRQVYKAGGFGFRNYWFRIPKNAVGDLKKMVK